MKNEESKIQQAFFEILRLNEKKYPQLKWIHAVPNGGHRSITTAKRLKAEGVKAGVWDVCIPITSLNDDSWHGAYIEFKAGTNKLTPKQKEFENHMSGEYYTGAVCYSVDEALDFIEEYLGIKLSR